jgi:hypothetical protein
MIIAGGKGMAYVNSNNGMQMLGIIDDAANCHCYILYVIRRYYHAALLNMREAI